MEQYIAAYDIGTSSVKLALVDASGKVLRSDTEGYPPCQLDGKRAEQDPGDYWNAVCRVTRRLACNVPAGAVCGLVLAAMWKGIIPLDRQGNTLHSNILWLDSRGEKQAAYLNQKLGEEILNGWDYWAKLLWFKENHPDLYRETDCFLEVNSYLKYRMTGIKLVDHCNAFTDSLDEGLKQFFRRIVEAAGFDES
ncbi:hypothetical protein LJC14_02460, partial [Treponema sp. OttesenSCG-928-L16]|nr:hypothetical protein [Treponema sp. OttesenSCG-928-L16]